MTGPARRPLVGGNWKMHLSGAEVEAYAASLRAGLAVRPAGQAEIVLFPSFPWIALAAAALGATGVGCGGQDLHPADQGAHTGDVSGPQLAAAGCSWVLCGHSERRRDHGESDALVARKVEAAARNGLEPLICVGEAREERRAGRTFEVLERQLTAALASRPDPFAVAYEPVWAIGTGETATPELAQQAHRFLRDLIADLLGDEVAAVRRLVYGGSVTPGNASELAACPDVDGFLVGGASLDPRTFLAIIGVCA